MGSLTALLLATPIFGFALHAPALDTAALTAQAATTVSVSAKMVSDVRPAADKEESGSSKADDDYVKELKQRNSIASIHRTLGIATWVSMTLTVAAGFIAYYNLYGFGAGIGDNPCVTGSAVGGDWGCGGIRPIKNTLAGVTTALYATTFTLSLMMPDPDNLSEGKGEFASTLRLHKTLRWVHFGGMIAQAILGIVIANGLGVDRANDYKTLQTLATVHMGVGLVTWGAMTWAGALMVF
ncbi:MAG: hypothetical protein RL701_2631 [Pseudomonadota bacterium]|jgi:hypothetical protein